MKAFGRRVVFQIGEREIKFPDLDIEFEVNFNQDSDGNVGHVRFYNLANSTIQLLKKDTSFALKAGYKDDIGLILPGVISSTSTRWENANKITEIIIGDATKVWLNKTINKTWRAGIKASQVAKDLVNTINLKVGEINLVKNIDYPKGKTFSGTIKKALEEIAKDTDTKLHISRDTIYLRPPEKGMKEVVLLNKDTGLLSSPQSIQMDDQEGYKVESLLNYRIEADSIVKIESQTADGTYRVKNGSHRKSEDDFVTELEVVAV